MPERNRRKYGLVAKEVDPRHRSSKDTKRWCHGKIGVEHDKQWRPEQRTRAWDVLPWREELACVNCNKVFESRYPSHTFGQALRAIREHRGLTQDQFGSLLGIQQSRVAYLENDTADISLRTVRQILDTLDIHSRLHIENVGDITISRGKPR